MNKSTFFMEESSFFANKIFFFVISMVLSAEFLQRACILTEIDRETEQSRRFFMRKFNSAYFFIE